MGLKTIYKDGCCQYTDGSPSFVKPGEDVDIIPDDYIKYAAKFGGDPSEAWRATMEWRRTKNVWNVLKTPTPLHRECDALDPLYYHGHSKDGYPVMWEVGSKIDCFRYTRVPGPDHLRRVHYFSEFGRNVLCGGGSTIPGAPTREPSPNPGIVFVMDYGGVDLAGYFGGGAFQNRCLAFDDFRVHCPLQVRHTLVINVPSMVVGVGKSILYRAMWGYNKPEVIPPSLSLERLRTQLEDDQIPQEYGGSSPYKLGQHPYQLKLEALLEEHLPKSQPPGVTPTTVVDDKSFEDAEEFLPAQRNLDNIHETDEVSEARGGRKPGESFVSLIMEFLSSIISFVAQLGDIFGLASIARKRCSSDASSEFAASLESTVGYGSDTSEKAVEGTVIDVPTEGIPHKKKKRRKTLPRLRNSLKKLSLKKRFSLPGLRIKKRKQKSD